MVEQDSLENMVHVSGVNLTNEQKMVLNNIVVKFRNTWDNIIEVLSNIYHQEIEPILDELREFINLEPNTNIRYNVVKIIRANSYYGVNKPITICCRSNC